MERRMIEQSRSRAEQKQSRTIKQRSRAEQKQSRTIKKQKQSRMIEQAEEEQNDRTM
jgi:hypothetical protein